MSDDFTLKLTFYPGYEGRSPEHVFHSDNSSDLIRKHKELLDKMWEDIFWYGDIECLADIYKGDKRIATSDTTLIGFKRKKEYWDFLKDEKED